MQTKRQWGLFSTVYFQTYTPKCTEVNKCTSTQRCTSTQSEQVHRYTVQTEGSGGGSSLSRSSNPALADPHLLTIGFIITILLLLLLLLLLLRLLHNHPPPQHFDRGFEAELGIGGTLSTVTHICIAIGRFEQRVKLTQPRSKIPKQPQNQRPKAAASLVRFFKTAEN